MERSISKAIDGNMGSVADHSLYSVDCHIFSDGGLIPDLKRDDEFIYISGFTILKDKISSKFLLPFLSDTIILVIPSGAIKVIKKKEKKLALKHNDFKAVVPHRQFSGGKWKQPKKEPSHQSTQINPF